MPTTLSLSRRLAVASVTALLAVGFVNCGKKGPPLPPFAKVPGAPTEVQARRKGSEVQFRFKVPLVNADGRRPAKIDQVQLYALTGPARGVTPLLFKKYATAVGSLLVRDPPPPPPEVKEGDPPPPPPPPRTDPGLDQGDPALLVDTMTAASMSPTDLPELAKAREEQAKASKKHPVKAPKVSPPDLGPPFLPAVVRYYAVAGLNNGNRGTATSLIQVPLDDAPPAPAAPTTTVAEGRIDVAWTPPDGLRRPVLPPLPPMLVTSAGRAASGTPVVPATAATPPGATGDASEPTAAPGAPAGAAPAIPMPSPPPPRAELSPTSPPPLSAFPAPPGAASPAAATAAQSPAGTKPPSGIAPPSSAAPPDDESEDRVAPVQTTASGNLIARLLTPLPATTYTYAVYEVAPPDYTPPAPLQPGQSPLYPVLLTPTATTLPKWSDPRFEVGKKHCYAVRTVATTGLLVEESDLSPTTCADAQDTFPPAAPKGLAAVASEGAISLIWDSNSEADLAGYVVLRGAAGRDRLSPITSTPIKETTFRDTTVKAGVRYAYVVVAVDTATPQNVSAQSNRVEETAR